MNQEIKTDGAFYCKNGFGKEDRCQHLTSSQYRYCCKLYQVQLKDEDLTDASTGRDYNYINRCDKCMNENR